MVRPDPTSHRLEKEGVPGFFCRVTEEHLVRFGAQRDPQYFSAANVFKKRKCVQPFPMKVRALEDCTEKTFGSFHSANPPGPDRPVDANTERQPLRLPGKKSLTPEGMGYLVQPLFGIMSTQ